MSSSSSGVLSPPKNQIHPPLKPLTYKYSYCNYGRTLKISLYVRKVGNKNKSYHLRSRYLVGKFFSVVNERISLPWKLPDDKRAVHSVVISSQARPRNSSAPVSFPRVGMDLPEIQYSVNVAPGFDETSILGGKKGLYF